MSIYTDLLHEADKGKPFKIDLVEKSLRINGKQIIEEGVLLNEVELIESYDLEKAIGLTGSLEENPWQWINDLYHKYKESVPKQYDNKHHYFKGLPIEELTTEQLAWNIDRHFAQAMLEGYILLASLKGWLKWEFGNNWFWRGDNEDLVVLKCLITNH